MKLIGNFALIMGLIRGQSHVPDCANPNTNCLNLVGVGGACIKRVVKSVGRSAGYKTAYA